MHSKKQSESTQRIFFNILFDAILILTCTSIREWEDCWIACPANDKFKCAHFKVSIYFNLHSTDAVRSVEEIGRSFTHHSIVRNDDGHQQWIDSADGFELASQPPARQPANQPVRVIH